MKSLLTTFCLVFGMIPLWGQELVSPEGLSEMRFVFEPGLKVGSETVSKTFQPSYVVTSHNTLLVFCQGRLKRAGDNEVKLILMNSSPDFGKTWDGVRVLSSPMNHFAMSPYVSALKSGERISFLTCVGLKVTKAYYDNDPDLLKEKTGIDLDMVGEDKAAVLCRYYSDDDGASWQLEVLTGENTPLYKEYEGYTPVFMNTIGQVHKIRQGPYKGRYIVAAPIYTVPEGEEITDNFRNHACSGSGVIFSDDMGETWQMEGMITDYLGNEASAVDINKGEELFMIRRYMDQRQLNKNSARSNLMPQNGQRIAHTSSDGGKTWSEPKLVNISHVKCHGTLARIKDRLYFSIPWGLGEKEKQAWDEDRVNGAIYFSDDEGLTWNHRIIEESYFSYSTVGKLSDTYRITIYSRGGHGDKGIAYRIFTDEWLEQNREKERISNSVVDLYIKGLKTRDFSLIRTICIDETKLYGVRSDGSLNASTLDRWSGRFDPSSPTFKSLDYEILSVDFEGTAAQVKIKFVLDKKRIIHDYLHMLKVEGKWRIVNIMDFFKGKVVFLTGGSRGLGPVIAESLAKRGASIALTARSKKGSGHIVNRSSIAA